MALLLNLGGGGHPQNKLLTGFTMAEVLITLGILGVVAAMTLPSLISKYQEKHWKVAYKKAYSSMSQAFLRMQANGEYLDIGANMYLDDAGIKRSDVMGENFKTMSKYFNTIKTCFDSNADECWVCDEGQAALTSSASPDWLGCKRENYAFVDYSGMAWYLYSLTEFPVLVDVNGNKNPNKLGQDRFVMKFATGFSDSDGMWDGNYDEDADRIVPWLDITTKQRWCPSGHCLYRTWLLE